VSWAYKFFKTVLRQAALEKNKIMKKGIKYFRLIVVYLLQQTKITFKYDPLLLNNIFYTGKMIENFL